MHDDIDESITNNENKLFNNLNLQHYYLKTYISYNKTLNYYSECYTKINKNNKSFKYYTFLFVVESLKFFMIPPVSDL